MLKKRQTETVSFRLDDLYLMRLEEEASKYGVSIHQQARQILMDTLEDGERKRLMDKVGEVSGSVSKVENAVTELRSDLAEAVEWMVSNLQTK